MMAMYTRSLQLPDRSFFLFGPRGTRKTTWLRGAVPGARFYMLRAHIAYAAIGGDLGYWRTPSGSEVDFIWSRGKHARHLWPPWATRLCTGERAVDVGSP